MLDPLALAALAVLCVSGLFASIKQLHMLQQNSYFPARYLGWLRGTFSARWLLPFLGFAAGCVFVLLGGAWAVFGLCALALVFLLRIPAAVRFQKRAVKKLVFTARVQRMLAAECLLLILLLVAAGFFPACGLPVLLFCFAAPVLTLCGWAVTLPLEKAFAAYYVADAKKRLRAQPGLTVIGITGSYGKTGTKYILGRILSEKFNTLITPESYNTPMGVVRTVRESLTAGTQVFIAEMGAKQRGDIAEICRIADPDIGLITSIGPQHLDTFGSVENILRTKLELADHVLAKGGRVYINTDNEYLQSKRGAAGYVAFGTADADCLLKAYSYSKDGLQLTLQKGAETFSLHSRLLGAHNALNITGAVALALDLGVPVKDIQYAVSTLKPVPHRLEIKPFLGGSTLIDDAYNSNPVGCMEAVRVLGSMEGMQKIIVTPGLVELGKQEYEHNYNLGRQAAKYCDKIILVGEQRSVPLRKGAQDAGFAAENLFVVPAFQAALTLLQGMCNAGTAVLLENDLPDNYLK